MSLLFEIPPETVRVGDEYLDIDADFRLWAEVQQCCDQGELDGMKMLGFMRRAFGTAARGQDVHDLVAAFLYFLSCGERSSPAQELDNTKSIALNHRNTAYDLAEDDARIVAAFEREYGIDLTTEYVHWWRFCALLDDLLSKDKFTDIVGFRCIDVSRIKDEKERAYYTEKQRAYRLHKTSEPQTVEELNASMVNALIKAREAAEAAKP